METKFPNLHLAPAKHNLVHANINRYKSKKKALILKNAIKAARKETKDTYHFILVDLPPSNGHFAVNGVMAADSVVLVLDPGQFSLEGIDTFANVFRSYCKNFGFKPEVSLALINKCQWSLNPFKNRGKEIAKKTAEKLEVKMHMIPYSRHIHEAHAKSLPISHYHPKSKVGLAYLKVAESLVES